MKLKSLIRALTIATLINPSALPGQLPAAGDRDPTGRVYAKMIVTITGEGGSFGHTVSDLRFIVVSENGDRISIRTNDAGVASTWVMPGSYRIVNPDPYPYDGNAYTWDVVVSIRPGTGIIRLSQSNAAKITALNPATSRTPAPAATQITQPLAVNPFDETNSITEGFFFAPHFLGASLKTEDDPVESGGGFGLSVGYGLSRMVAFYLNLDFARVDIIDPDIEGTYDLGQGDLGVRFNFLDRTHKGVPYAQAAFTGRVAQTTIEGSDVQISGSAITAGAGFNYYFQPKLALDIGLSYSFGSFDDLKIDGDDYPMDKFDASGARFQIGLTWFPFATRVK
jgi:hypothetical protein